MADSQASMRVGYQGHDLRVVFMGTPEFAVPSLSALAEATDVALVVTRPDAVRGRGKALVPSPVKARALELGLEVAEARRVDAPLMDRIRAAAPDLVVVTAYGAILPDELLELAPLPCVNVHASLLPRWRGAAPIQRAALAGDERIGVSVMRVVHDLDAGAYCAQASLAAADHHAGPALMDALAELGAQLLADTLPALADGSVTWTEQDEALVTYAHKVAKEEMLLDPADPAEANARRVLASLDSAPARCVVAGKGVRVVAARVAGAADAAAPVPASGAFARVGKARVLLGCADGALEPLVVKPDGKREMEASAWALGLPKAGSWGRA